MSQTEQPQVQPKDDEKALRDTFLSIAYQSEFTRRDLIKGLFAVAGAAVLFGMPTEARAASATRETLDALADAQAEYEEVEQRLDAIASEYQALSEKQSETLQQMEDVQAQIDETEEEIEQMQEELDEKQAGLADRVSASYKKGGNDALSLLLSSASFDELLSNVYYIDKINESDREAIAEIQRIQEELDARKKALEEQMAELEALKEQQAEQLSNMQEKQAEAQDLLNNLSQEVKDLIAKRDNEILIAAQAEAAAAEEARRQQQQQQGSGGGGGYIPEVGSGQDYNASSGAQKRIVNACYATPSPGQGYCAAWVSRVFQRAGFGYIGGNACDMYSSYCSYSSKSALKVGMIVAVSTHSHSAAGRIWGHVGIYIGDNHVMENIGPINTNNLDTWCQYYGTTVTPRWGWARGIDLSTRS